MFSSIIHTYVADSIITVADRCHATSRFRFPFSIRFPFPSPSRLSMDKKKIETAEIRGLQGSGVQFSSGAFFSSKINTTTEINTATVLLNCYAIIFLPKICLQSSHITALRMVVMGITVGKK